MVKIHKGPCCKQAFDPYFADRTYSRPIHPAEENPKIERL